MYRFIPVTEDTDPLNISVAIAGGSGTGKTYSAMRLARGMAGGEPFGFVDTEGKRALHYRGDFPEMHRLDLGPEEGGRMVGYPTERVIDVLDAAEDAKLPVLVWDSFSHVWEGIGGVLEQHAFALERLSGGDQAKADRVSSLAWAEVKPKYRRLINRIIRSRSHMVICMRAKPVVQKWDKAAGVMKNAFGTKLRREDLPWDIAADGDLIFEMAASMLMVPERPGYPFPLKCADQFKGIFNPDRVIDEDVGRALVEWSEGNLAHHKKLFDTARSVARSGRAAIRSFRDELSEDDRKALMRIQNELLQIVEDSDRQADDPFAEPAAKEPA